MRRRDSWRAGMAVMVAALTTLGAALTSAQDPGAAAQPPANVNAKANNGNGNGNANDNGKAATGKTTVRKTRAGGLRVRNAAPSSKVEKGDLVADPLAPAPAPAPAAGNNPEPPARWPYHFRFKLISTDGTALTARFYPSRAGTAAAVMLMVHQSGTGHSGQDFEEPVESLKGRTIAEHFQSLDYAVLIVDRRGHGGALARQQVVSRDPATLVDDLQTAYTFLIDRHNRRELNLAKLGVLAVGDGANLAVLWAASPTGAVSSPGRDSDLGGLVLVCPTPDAFNSSLEATLRPIAPHLPMLLIAGSRDAEMYRTARPLLERNRASQGVLLDTRLQNERLLQFEPKIIDRITKFLDDPVKFRADSAVWEPRYLLSPVVYQDIERVLGKAEAEVEAEKKEPEDKAAEKKAAEKKEPAPAPKEAAPEAKPQ